MCVTMNRCGHLYAKIPYSKQCLHWIQISCHSQSKSNSHISGSAYFSSVIGALSTASTEHTHGSSHALSLLKHDVEYAAFIKLPIFNAYRNATHWPSRPHRSHFLWDLWDLIARKCGVHVPYTYLVGAIAWNYR